MLISVVPAAAPPAPVTAASTSPSRPLPDPDSGKWLPGIR
jgi:hypothetical protein